MIRGVLHFENWGRVGAWGCCLFVLLILLNQPASGQLDPPLGTTVVGTWDQYTGAYADVWGAGDYAYVCHFGDAGVEVLDISDPAVPFKVAEIRADPPDDFSSQQDVKTGDGLAFIALESNNNNAVLIVDIRVPTAPVKKTIVSAPFFSHSHNVFYHDRILYVANSQTTHIAIFDLTDYDPDNAPAAITTPLWTINYGTSFVHDIHVHVHDLPGGTVTRLYACGWNSGLGVYDISDIRNEPPVFLGSAPGSSTHSVWATDDGRFVITGEERGGGGIKSFEITENGGGSVSLTLRDSFALPGTQAFTVHNQILLGYRLFNAWYQAGLQVFDLDPVTGELDLVASRDTFPFAVSGFDGAWGIYVQSSLPNGVTRVFVSDLETGFHIIDVQGATTLTLPNGLPETVHPQNATPVVVKAVEGGAPINPATVTLHVTITGQPTADIPMTSLGSGLYGADLPPVPCDATVDYYFSAETTLAETVSNPTNAPIGFYTLAPLSNICENLRHDFETASGWTVGAAGDGVTGGLWVRGDPIGTSAQPEDDNPNGTGTMCFVTGQGPVGGGVGVADVDGGKTTLVSPIFSATGSDVWVGYARWYSNDQGASPNSDQMEIDISNNGGSSWTSLEIVTENKNAWVEKFFRVADFLAPTANMRLRFVAQDLGSGSVVEAAIDDFVLVNIVCTDPLGNTNIDGDLDLADFTGFPSCMTGPGVGVSAGCCAYDTDLDDDVDMDDYLTMHVGFTGPL
ncbi:MAG: hypothetical protein AABZ47_13520 [Planctomycetota bacterium]